MTAQGWLARAELSLSSARLLLESDPDAACSRAYYSMFYAARAALLHVGQQDAALAKTHSGVIAAFGEHLVKSGLIDAEQGRAFSKVERERLIADDSGDGVLPEAASLTIERADGFLRAVQTVCC